MALVPQHTYEAWFKRTSWVFSSYSFLFKNPLWDRSVPKGSSLCIFFWLAIFSVIVFRPLVYLTLGVGAAVKTLRLQRLIAWTDSISPFDGPPSMPTVIAMMVVFVIGMFVTILGAAAVNCWQAGIFGAFALPAVLLGTLVTTGTYYSKTKYDSNRCKVEIYLRVVTVLCLISAAVFHPAYAYASFIQFPLEMVALVWDGIVTAALWVAHFLWGGALWTWTFLPWLLAVGGALGLYGWVSMRLMNRPVARGTTVETVSAAERKRRLKELANEFHQTDGWTTTFSWWERILRGCDDLLDAVLGAPVWDPVSVTVELRAQLMARASAIHQREQEAAARRATQCRAATNALLKVLTPVIWTLKQLNILRSYLWQLVKARKQGVCPFLTFHD